MGPKKGRGDQLFVPVSKDKEKAAELKFCGFKWIMKGQTLQNSNGNVLMECKLCTSGRVHDGEEEEDREDERRAIEGREDDDDSYMPLMDVRTEEERARGKMRREKAIDNDNTPGEDDDDTDDDDDHDADIGASLDEGLMAGGRRGQEGPARAMMEATRSNKRKRKAKKIVTGFPPAHPVPKKSRVLRPNSMVEAFDPVWQRDFYYFLQWYFVSNFPLEAARRPKYHRLRKHLLECPLYTHPALLTHSTISMEGIPEQQQIVADLVAAVRKDIATTGATILTDGRKSIMSNQIVNFLAAGPTGAYLFRTTQWDGAVEENVEVVVERWKDVFDKFSVDNVNVICTNSASAYVAASKLLAKEELKYSHITWLPCAVHVCHLLLSDITKGGTNGKIGKREDTIIRARAVVRYVLSWEDDEEEAEDAIPPPRDEGVRPADRVTEAQLGRQVQRGQRDRLSKAPPSVETYLGRRATVLMPTEVNSVYDPEPNPMAQDPIQAEPWFDPDDLWVESEPGGSHGDGDDAPLTEMMRPRTRGFTAAPAPPPSPPRPSTTRNVPLRGPEDRVGGMIPHPPTDRRRHDEQGSRGNVEEGDDDDVRRGYEGSSEDEDDPGYSPTRPRGDNDEGGDGTYVQWDDQNVATAQVIAVSGEVAAESTEVAVASTEVGAASSQTATVSAETGGANAEVGGTSAEVGGASAQFGVSFSDDIFGASLGLPPTPAGEHHGGSGGADVQATPICQILRERMLEMEDGAGHCTTEDAEVDCSGAVGGEAGDRPASAVQGVCVFPFAGAMSTGELEWQARKDPLGADRRRRMDEASRRVMAEGPAYVPCSPSVSSSTTDVIPPTRAEGPGLTPSPISAPVGESPSPKSRKKKMRAGKSLSTVRRVTHQMRASRPGLADLHPRTWEALGEDVAADTLGWRHEASTWGTKLPMTARAEAVMPRAGGRTSTTSKDEHDTDSSPPGRSMVGRILGEDVRALTTQRSSPTLVGWELRTDGLEMPVGQRRKVSVYDLLRAWGGVEAAAQGVIHAPDTAHGPAGGTGGGDGSTGVTPQRRRKDMMDDDDV
ncbi:hypothetical protein CBR_g51774 [Chara braunii]|uniref:DUF659 domain-containing protein n=1 Tax=Chara braunii TaxID=69332 RepID=A0A388M900_CHABU|nr:hypothetical protein CBR_g51774 [Chara braunii]|eukprot:GBG91041.1 hypothetical protein CBR_g51774 [Chara braunii]